MSQKFGKHSNMDKWEGFLPTKDPFMQDDYYTSKESDQFHMSRGYGYPSRGRGFNFGTQKKIWKASGQAVQIDSYSVGKSDE